MKQGLVKLNQSGMLAQQGKFAESQKAMSEARAEIDGAVDSDPQNATLRYRRGSVYAMFPDFFNLKPIAKADLEIAVKDPRYTENATKALEKITGAKPKDRFSQVPESTSPLIAVASVTFPGSPTLQSRKDLPELLARMMKEIETYPGFLGSHVLSSVDRNGMILLFTWWKDKQSLAGWVDGAAHRGAIREIYSKPAGSATGTQVAMELFAPIAGSMQFGGGLAPETVSKMEKR